VRTIQNENQKYSFLLSNESTFDTIKGMKKNTESEVVFVNNQQK